jgi:hypothetical protein
LNVAYHPIIAIYFALFVSQLLFAFSVDDELIKTIVFNLPDKLRNRLQKKFGSFSSTSLPSVPETSTRATLTCDAPPSSRLDPLFISIKDLLFSVMDDLVHEHLSNPTMMNHRKLTKSFPYEIENPILRFTENYQTSASLLASFISRAFDLSTWKLPGHQPLVFYQQSKMTLDDYITSINRELQGSSSVTTVIDEAVIQARKEIPRIQETGEVDKEKIIDFVNKTVLDGLRKSASDFACSIFLKFSIDGKKDLKKLSSTLSITTPAIHGEFQKILGQALKEKTRFLVQMMIILDEVFPEEGDTSGVLSQGIFFCLNCFGLIMVACLVWVMLYVLNRPELKLE